MATCSNKKATESFAWRSIRSAIDTFKHGITINGQGDVSWKKETSGSFSVKSAYKLALEWHQVRRNYRGEPSDELEKEGTWKKLWKQKLPDRVKLMGWRLIYDALPLADNLEKRRCTTENSCWSCGFKKEDSLHVFIKCWWTRALWSKLGIKEDELSRIVSVAGWLWEILSSDSIKKIEIVLVGLWVIWGNRNQLAHGHRGKSVDCCYFRVKSLLKQFGSKSIWGGFSPGVRNVEDHEEENITNIYCDGSWDGVSCMGGFAAVAVNKNIVEVCSASWWPNVSSAKEAEWRALVEGVKLARATEGKVRLLSDSAEVVWGVQTGSWEGGECVLEDSLCEELINKSNIWSIEHELRGTNGLADWLAKKARCDRWSWSESNSLPMIMADAFHSWRSSLQMS